jgi:sulfatase modifying factor 1
MRSLLGLFLAFSTAFAQPLVDVETVFVGDPLNEADLTGFGGVSYAYRIGKYEVTIAQYTAFLNSVARYGDNHRLWTSGMEIDRTVAGIQRRGSGTPQDPYVYSEIGPFGSARPIGANVAGNRPIAYVSWFSAARFCNWLHNGATEDADTETGAYALNGALEGDAPARNPDAKWWIPTENEWYKAAYYKGGSTNAGYWLYPTQSDTPPSNDIQRLSDSNSANYFTEVRFAVTQASLDDFSQNYLTSVGAFSNSASAYGTYDQGGNLHEWNDYDGVPGPTRGRRGGDRVSSELPLSSEDRYLDPPPDQGTSFVGFRVATVPTSSDPGVTSEFDLGVLAGRSEVINNPSTYGLFTQPQYDANRIAGRQDVISDPVSFNLYDETSIMDLSFGAKMVKKEGGNAVFELRLQTSTNLVTQPFSDYGDPITNTIPMPGRAGFLRVRAVDAP